MSLRVLHVAPLAPGGGTSNFIERQIGRLSEAFVDAHTILFEGFAMRVRLQNLFAKLSEIRHYIRIFKPDIVHAHWGSILAFTASLATINGPPLVITYRGSDINPVPSESSLFRLPRFVFSQLAALRAAAVICVSPKIQERLWTKRGLIKIIPDGTDLSIFRFMDKLECREQLNWHPDERILFFYEGGRPAVKRRDLADAALDEAKRLLGRCRLEVLDSGVPYSRMPILLNAADCLLMTSDFEGSPNIVREALMCRLPIVSVDVGDVSYWIKGMQGTKLVPRDPVRIGRAAARIIVSGIRPQPDSIAHLFSDITSSKAIIETYVQILRANKVGIKH